MAATSASVDGCFHLHRLCMGLGERFRSPRYWRVSISSWHERASSFFLAKKKEPKSSLSVRLLFSVAG